MFGQREREFNIENQCGTFHNLTQLVPFSLLDGILDTNAPDALSIGNVQPKQCQSALALSTARVSMLIAVKLRVRIRQGAVS